MLGRYSLSLSARVPTAASDPLVVGSDRSQGAMNSLAIGTSAVDGVERCGDGGVGAQGSDWNRWIGGVGEQLAVGGQQQESGDVGGKVEVEEGG